MTRERFLSRREVLRIGGMGLLCSPLATLAGCGTTPTSRTYTEPGGAPYEGTDEQLLDEMQRATFSFFWNEASQNTGQVKDRALANGNDSRLMSSIAATGFGLASLCIGDQRGYGKSADILERVRKTLRFLANTLANEHGFFFHFINMETGQRWEKCELSSIDTSILLCGVLTARQYFAHQEIKDLATTIYERVDWPWMLNGGKTLSMGWTPESGFLNARWEHYCELMMIYLLGIGSPTHPLPPSSWDAWTRPTIKYQGIEYISGNDPIFTHQYSHAWYDFRNKRDAYTDYLKGYTAWGGPPPQGPIDGSIVPCATGGSLPFLFDDCARVLRNLRGRYRDKVWVKYSFVDAFNPLIGWYDLDVLGIDLGITMLMAENHRGGLVWDTFMKDPEAQSAMQKAGFH